ncbi:MAG: pyridoxamine 5'-phosphate oxidase family protein [Clostridia bacterium]|nr:pyridoxamine 5'-phosphate oxidase family protein [Clostridia bacterium]
MRRKDREVSNIEEIKSIIEKCRVCHLAMVDKGLPYVIPLNFGYKIADNSLVLFFHSAKEGRKIDILKENNEVCFEMAYEGKLGHVENPCNSGYYFESVHGFGHVEFIEDIDEKCNALTQLMKHQTNQDFIFTEMQANSVCILKVVSSNFVGKRKPNPNMHTE